VGAVVGGALLWYRLLLRRFGAEPLLLALGLLLSAGTGTWLVYGVMLKQYSLELLLALVPFTLDDDFYDRTLRRGERRWQVLPLVAIVTLSYSYVIPLLGRVLGWYASGLRTRGTRLSPGPIAIFLCTLGAGAAFLYFVELRHTVGTAKVLRFWDGCVPTGDPIGDWNLFRGTITAWYSPYLPFSRASELPGPIGVALGLAFLAGVVTAGRRSGGARPVERTEVPRRTGPDPTPVRPDDWQSRSLGCAIAVFGLFAASYVVGFPACPGRLTLFALPLMQILMLDGLAAARDSMRRVRFGRGVFVAGMVVLLLPVGLSAARTLAGLWSDLPYQDVRPLLPFIDERPDLPVVVDPCSKRQLLTLPEWRGREGIIQASNNRFRRRRSPLPRSGEYWLVMAGDDACAGFEARIRDTAENVTVFGPADHSAHLLLVRLPEDNSSEAVRD
jgi:hypothetical protein